MDAIEQGSLVVVHCLGPREKLWGVLLRLDQVGAVVRGLDLNTVEDWMAQETAGLEPLIGPSTVFLPTHRLERIYLDEASGLAASIGGRFLAATGREAREALVEGREEA